MKYTLARAVRSGIALLAALPPAMGLASTAPAAALPADTVVLPAVYEVAPALPWFATSGTAFAATDWINGKVFRSTTGTAYATVGADPRGTITGSAGFAWWLEGPWSGPGTMHRLNVATGTVTDLPYAGDVVAVNATGHLEVDVDTQVMSYVADGGTRADMGPAGRVSMDATAAATAVETWNDSLMSYETTIRLRPLSGADPRDVATFAGSTSGLVLTPNSIVWLKDTGGAVYLQRQPRNGGTTTSVKLPLGWTPHLAATDTAALMPDGASCLMYRGATKVPVVLPAGYTLDCRDAVGVGAKFYAATNEKGTAAGVYSIDPVTGASTKVASPPPTLARVELDFNAGKLYGADTKESLESRRIWSRSIGGTVGAESLFPQRASGSGILAFTGNRAWIESLTAYNSRLFEGSTLVKEVPDSLQDGDVSGPYLLTSGDVNGDWVYQVKRTDGAVVWTLSSTVAASTALFGSRVVWEKENGEIWVQDVAKAASATNPRLARASQCANWCSGYLRTWGDLVVETTDSGIASVNLATGAVGTISRSLTHAVATDGAVLFTQNNQLYAWTATTGAAPVLIAPVLDQVSFAAENGKVAWVGPDGVVRVASMPIAATSRPRMLGIVGTPAVFAPNVTGQAKTWKPQIDLTEDLTSWTWTLRKGTTVVRTLTGTTANAAIRTLAWDGKDGAGALVGNGRYTWSLTGSAKDGSGTLASVDGSSTVTGTIDVSTQVPAPLMRNPVVASSAGTTTTIPVSWTVLNPTGGVAVTFDVQYRSVTRDAAGVQVFGAPTAWRTATTARTANFTGAAHSTWQFQARAKDQYGRVSAWTPWTNTIFPWDDRELITSGTWSDLTAATSWAGTSRATTASGASLQLTNNTAQIAVVGSRGPTSGSMRVYVDGSLVATVDLYAATATVRDVLWTSAVPYGSHTVRVANLPASGRTLMAIDAIGFGL